MPPRQISFKSLIYLHPEGEISTYYGPRRGRHFSRSKSFHHSPHDRSIGFRRHTSCSSYSHSSSSCHPLADGFPITTHTVTPTGIVAPHSALATSPTDISHATPQTRPSLTPADLTTLHRKHSQEKQSYIQDLQPPNKPHCSKTVTIQDSPTDSDSDSDPLNY